MGVLKTSRHFKLRYYEHKMAMKNEGSKHATALSNFIHKLKKEGVSYVIKWSIKVHQREGSNCIRRPQASPQQQIRVAKQVHSPHKCWIKETQILTPHLRGQSSHFFNKSHNDRATTSVTQFIHFFTHSPQGISKKVTLLLFNFIPFLKIT